MNKLNAIKNVQTVVALHRDYVGYAELPFSQITKKKANNRQMLLRVFSNVHTWHVKFYHFVMEKKMTRTTTSDLD